MSRPGLWEQLRGSARVTVVSAPPGSGKTVALTFDDGPGASTASIVSILARYGVPATFFNLGQNMAARPALVQQEASLGYVLDNHTWDHPNMTTRSASAQGTEMDQATAEQVEPWYRDTLTGDRHRLAEIDALIGGGEYRPRDPGWEISQALANAAFKDPDCMRGFVSAAMVLSRAADVTARPATLRRCSTAPGSMGPTCRAWTSRTTTRTSPARSRGPQMASPATSSTRRA